MRGHSLCQKRVIIATNGDPREKGSDHDGLKFVSWYLRRGDNTRGMLHQCGGAMAGR